MSTAPATERHTGRLLFVDDEEAMRTMMEIVLGKDGHAVDTAASGEEALELFRKNDYDMVIQDLRMPGLSGIELLQRLSEIDADVPVVIVTAFSTWDSAVEAMRIGAYDYLKKPFDTEEVRALVQRALQMNSLSRRIEEETSEGENEGVSLPEMLASFKIIGSTPPIQHILSLVRRVSATDSTVVIQGESGTGKELVARMIHLQSPRREGPFIGVNCGAFAETLLESEIFGHVRGAFTGAIADKKGLLEIAHEGTFFLDELGEMSPQTQVRLLRVLETREFNPVGGTRTIKINTRFVAATNRDLKAMVEQGTFREDLYYRLNVIPIQVPPLRERREDIPLLAGHFLAVYSHAFGRPFEGFDEEAMKSLMRHNWPGNVRELQNTIQRAVTLAGGPRIGPGDLTFATHPAGSDGGDALVLPEEGFGLEARLAEIERDYIQQALEKTGGNLTQAAELLGITFRSIRYKVKKLEMEV